MEKLIVVLKEGIKYLDKGDAKKFNNVWMEKSNGKWIDIEEIHFEVSHLNESKIAELILVLEDSIGDEDRTWTEQIDWKDKSFLEDEKDESLFKFGYKDYAAKARNIKPTSMKLNVKDLPSKGKFYDFNSVDINYGIDAGEEINKILEDYYNNTNINNINYQTVYKYNDKEEISLIQQMTFLISSMINNPTIVCEDSSKKDNILNYLSCFDINTKNLANNLLNKGSLAYEKIYNDYENIVGLNEINYNSLKYKSNDIFIQNEKEYKRVLLKDQLSIISFYPNDEFKSYKDMMEEFYNSFNLNKDEFKLMCIKDSNTTNNEYPSFCQSAFIKKSFIDCKHFNIVDNLDNEINNSDDFTFLLDCIQKEISYFYTDLIKSDKRFVNYNFKINF